MRKLRPNAERNFSPLRDKVLASILRQLLVTEFGYQNKVIFADVMISEILKKVEAFVKPLSSVKPGQLVWMAVVNDGAKHTFQKMRDTTQVPLVLDLITDSDLKILADGGSLLKVRRQRHARLLDQALAQGGVLAINDLSAITLTGQFQVRGDIAHVKETENRTLPHRGSVQDIGPTVSHKVQVARLLEAGHLEPDICRMLSPTHDLRSVERYAQTYKNVLKLLEGGFAPSDITGILSLSTKLVGAYTDLAKELHPEIMERNPYLEPQESDPQET